jgi:hypothetical protein
VRHQTRGFGAQNFRCLAACCHSVAPVG